MELRGFLLDRDIGIFDAILYDRLDRFDEILSDDDAALERPFGSYTNVEAHEQSWQTPLAWAADSGKADAVRALVERSRRHGKTP